MTPNIWEFVSKADGTYSVSHNGKRLSDFIAEEYFEAEICERYGFCGKEINDIRGQLNRCGKCTVDLSSSSPSRLASIKRDFGWDPLRDRQGNRMTWSRRIAPQRA